MKIELLPPQEGELMTVADRAYTLAAELVIDSQEMADTAAEELRAIAKRKDELGAWRKRITNPLDEAKAAVMDLFRRPIERMTAAEAVLKQALIAYNNEQRRLRELEEARRRAEAEAERQRLEAEARAAREAAEALAAAGNAAAAEQAVQQAEQASMMSEMVIAPAPAVEAPKVAGTSMRMTPDPDVVDKVALIRHIAANEKLANLLDVNMTALRAAAKVYGIGSTELPGVVIRGKQTLATSRK